MAETHVLVKDDEWWRSIMSDEHREANSQPQGPKIPKVPPIFRGIESNKECYEPLLVSIGPYHHGKPCVQDMEKSKFTMARQFFQQSDQHIEDVYKKVANMAEDAGRCYAEDESFKLDDKIKFTQMMFLDGCFLIQFMHCLLYDRENLKMTSHVAAMVTRDMLLLENQLPFLVLRSLMNLRFEDDQEGMKLIGDFFKHIRAMPHPGNSCKRRISKFYRKVVLRRLGESTANQKGVTTEEYSDAGHLLELFHMHFVDRKIRIDHPRTTRMYRYNPAMELRKVGIHFKPSKTSLFNDFNFRSTIIAARLRIPPLRIDDSTKSLLLNLVAYEACLAKSNDWIASYVCFMDSLIDHPEDVKKLRSDGILLTSLGSDQQVAELFNEIANNLVPNPCAFMEVQTAIESHYKKPFKRWVAQCMSSHFSSPWSFIALAAAIFTIALTAIQSYFAMFPHNNNSDSYK